MAEMPMLRGQGSLAIFAAAVLTALPAKAQEPPPGCHGGLVNVEERRMRTNAIDADAAEASLCLYQGATGVHLEVKHVTIAEILSAMAGPYQISYRSSVPLSELRSGRYSGPVGSVISNLLDGYNYAISHHSARLDIVVFDKSGGRAVPSPLSAEPSPPPATEAKPPRSPVTVSRAH
jgi:hypothetical protein